MAMPPANVLTLAALLAGTCTAAAIDLRVRRVPNWLTGSLAATGLLLAGTGLGELSMQGAWLGGVLGLLLMLPGYLLGGTGAGDVKLLAATGMLLGPTATLWAFVFTLMAGGAIALAVAAVRGRLWLTLLNSAQLVTTRGGSASLIERSGSANRFAYAPAVAVGVMAAALFV